MITVRQAALCLWVFVCFAIFADFVAAQQSAGKPAGAQKAVTSLTGEQSVPDVVFRKNGSPAIGHLQSMLAFATLLSDAEQRQQHLDVKKRPLQSSPKTGRVKQPAASIPATTMAKRPGGLPGRLVARDEISLILLDGKSLPAGPPNMPPDEDSVLLDSGQVLTGMVMVPGEKVFCGGTSVPIEEVTLIRLKNDDEDSPHQTQPNPEQEGEQDDDPPKPGLGHWVGTIAYSADDTQGKVYGNITHACLRVSWKEVDEFPESAAKHGNTSIRLDNTWIAYRIETEFFAAPSDKDPHAFRPSPIRSSGLLTRRNPHLQARYFLTNAKYEKNFPLEKYPGRMENGQYQFKGPSFEPEDVAHWKVVHWRNRIIPKWQPEPDMARLAASLSAICTWCDGRDFLAEHGSRMIGRASHNIGGPTARLHVGEWDLRRVAASPAPPDVKNEKQPEDEVDCEYYRERMEDAEAYDQEQQELDEKLYKDLRDTEDQLEKMGWTPTWRRPNPTPGPPDPFDWTDVLSKVLQIQMKMQDPNPAPKAKTAADKQLDALKRKYGLLWEESIRLSGARANARIDVRHYREAYEDCEKKKMKCCSE